MWCCLKYAYEVPNWTMPNWIALNWTIQSQTKACIAKSSCEISTFLRCYAVLSGNSVLMLWHTLLVPCSSVKKSTRENTVPLKLTVTIESCPSSNFLKTHEVLEAVKEAPNLVEPNEHHRKRNLLRHVLENKSSTMVKVKVKTVSLEFLSHVPTNSQFWCIIFHETKLLK